MHRRRFLTLLAADVAAASASHAAGGSVARDPTQGLDHGSWTVLCTTSP